MRLRYLHLRDVPPLTDVYFPLGHEDLLGREVIIRFVVGLNGSGKTRLLQSLAKAFLCLESGNKLPFHITLAYDLNDDLNSDRKRTIYWRYQPDSPDNNGLIEFDGSIADEFDDWEELKNIAENEPLHIALGRKEKKFSYRSIVKTEEIFNSNLSRILPKSVLIYTSGAVDSWNELFSISQNRTETETTFVEDDERPYKWDESAEIIYQREIGFEEVSETISEPTTISSAEPIGIFVELNHLKLVSLSVCLTQAISDFQLMKSSKEETLWLNEKTDEINQEKPAFGLRAILNEIGWLMPVTIGLHINFDLSFWRKNRANLSKLEQLYNSATEIVKDSAERSGRWLYFDLRKTISTSDKNDTTAAVLSNILGEDDSDPFPIFKTLYQWQKQSLLNDVSMTIKKHNLEDLLLFDWLSDGEKVFFGRMALLYLMKSKPDSLILLDEPETHFNDYWKRRLVDVIDDNLRDVSNEVLISTHSSIALTDAFKSEITVLSKKENTEGKVIAFSAPIQTFGSTPSEIMRTVFGNEDVVGQRANEFLDMVLKITTFPTEAKAIWDQLKENRNDSEILNSVVFNAIWEEVSKLHNYEDKERLLNVMRHLSDYIKKLTGIENTNVADVLKVIEEKLGPGYYRFEFNRRLSLINQEI